MFVCSERVNGSQLTMESFDQYLTLVQNDIQLKLNTLKSHVDKCGEQFIENLKLMRKEVHK